MATKWSYVSERVKCGKAGCKRCPHGPYWYRYRVVGGRTKKQYVGKDRYRFDGGGQSADRGASDSSYAASEENLGKDQAPIRWDDIYDDSKASLYLAKEILGMDAYRRFDLTEFRSRVRDMLRLHHPDRGGDERMFKLVSAAWSYYQKVFTRD